MRKLLVPASFACSMTAVASTAMASGFATARFGGEHGNPITFNPTAVYYNPAGLAESTGFHLFGDVNIAFRGATFKHEPIASCDATGGTHPCDTPEPPGAEGANTD